MSEPIYIKVPFVNVNDPTAKIVDWKVPSLTRVRQNEDVVELETTKTTFPVPAPADGYLEYNLPLGEEVPVGGDLFRIHADEASARAGVVIKIPGPPAVGPVVPATGAPMISKKAQELITANGLLASDFAGFATVKESDVRAKLEARTKAGASAPAPVPAISPAVHAPQKLTDEPGELIPLGRAKLVENRELMAVHQSILKGSVNYFCPAGGLQEACARQNPPVQRLVVILFELVKLLKKYPRLNSYYVNESVFEYNHVHIGFAVDMGRGLKVLVVREAEQLDFAALGEKVQDLLVKYATDDLSVQEVIGSTFTVTDLAQTGLFSFEPLVNSRQTAILGIGAETVLTGGILGGFMLSCAFDHRVTTGRVIAEMLAELSGRLAGHAASLGGKAGADVLFCSRCLQTVEQLRVVQAFLMPSIEPPGLICSHCLSGQ